MSTKIHDGQRLCLDNAFVAMPFGDLWLRNYPFQIVLKFTHEQIQQALAYSAAGSVRWDLQEELDDETRTRKVKEFQKKRTQGKILVAKQKWDEKKKSKGI